MSASARPPEGSATPLMGLARVSKAYRQAAGSVQALRDVQLLLHPGELVAVTGPSGSGKSTLLNLCGLIDTPDEGEMAFAGHPLAGQDETSRALLRRAHIGFVFQNFNLIPVMSARENVEYPLFLLGVPAAESRTRAEAMLARVGLGDFTRQRPDRLSGGQRQRVAIARAVVKSPRLVIADEPTASLDSTNARQVVTLMRELAHEHRTAFLIATHDDRLTPHCDRVLALADGVIRPQG